MIIISVLQCYSATMLQIFSLKITLKYATVTSGLYARRGSIQFQKAFILELISGLGKIEGRTKLQKIVFLGQMELGLLIF